MSRHPALGYLQQYHADTRMMRSLRQKCSRALDGSIMSDEGQIFLWGELDLFVGCGSRSARRGGERMLGFAGLLDVR